MNTAMPHFSNPAALLRHAAETWGDRPALVCRIKLRDETWTYAQLLAMARTAARRLRVEHGLQPGERVLIRGENGPALVAAYFGAFFARLVLVPVDRHSSLEFMARIAADTEAAAFIGEPHDPAPPGLRRIPLGVFAAKAAGPEPNPFDEPGPDELAEIVFTSGTTGAPKGVMLTHGNIAANVAAITHLYPTEPGRRFLSLLPLSHMLEQTAGLFTPLLLGATIYFPESRHPAALLKRIRRSGIHGLVVVPQLLGLLYSALSPRIGDGRWLEAISRLPFSLRRGVIRRRLPDLGANLGFIVCGGAALPGRLEADWERLGIRVVQGYGATECAPILTGNSYSRRLSGSVGWPVPGVELRISEEGEIQARGANVTSGYWRNPEATAAAFTEDGWYRTGDRGAFGPAGDVRVTGRCRDMIVLANGLNVFPEDIEPRLACQPGIAASVVLDLPGGDGCPAVTAVLRVADETATPEERENVLRNAVQAANRDLDAHQRIVAWRLWTGDFPRTALQKIKRQELRSALLAQGDRGAIPAANSAQDEETVLRGLLAAACRIDPARIGDGADLEMDLGLDSLGRVALATAIEQRLGVQVDDADLAGLRTVADLGEQVRAARHRPPPPPYPGWPLSMPVRAVRRLVRGGLLFPALDRYCEEFRVEGREVLESLELPALFISNHASHADTASILRALPKPISRRIAVAAAADYFFDKPWASAAVRVAINAFPFVRIGSVRPSLEHCGELADAGWSVLIYPEGTRSGSGELLPFKPGVGLLATGLRVPVVPIAVHGGRDILPKGRRLPRRGRVRVRFGEPLRLPGDMGPGEAAELLRDAVERLLVDGPEPY